MLTPKIKVPIYYLAILFSKITWKRENFPVGCILPVCWLYMWWLPLDVSDWGGYPWAYPQTYLPPGYLHPLYIPDSRISQSGGWEGGAWIYYLTKFLPKNYSKTKEIGLRRGHVPDAPLDPPMNQHLWEIFKFFVFKNPYLIDPIQFI